MPSDCEGARRWQQLAEEASSIARKMTDPEAIQIMRHIVQSYEILAEHAKKVAPLADNPQPWCTAPEVGERGGGTLWSTPGHGTQHGAVRRTSPATRAGCPTGGMLGKLSNCTRVSCPLPLSGVAIAPIKSLLL